MSDFGRIMHGLKSRGFGLARPMVFVCALGASACGDALVVDTRAAALTVDGWSTPETANLFSRLRGLSGALLVGHVDDNVMGINRDGTGWWYERGRSDVRAVVGDYPAIFGFDLVDLEGESTQWSPEVTQTLDKIREAYRMRGIITVSWHEFNPVTGGNYHSGSPVPELLPGGANHWRLRGLLDKIASLLGNLRDDRGRLIPIIFRPWHEANGAHFWWGVGRCTDEEYKQLFRFTVDYLRNDRAVHNLLYAYSPVDWNWNMQDYFARYPGDEYIDILGLDSYGDSSTYYHDRLRYYAREMTIYAAQAQKIAGFTELGFKLSESEAGLAHSDDPHWFRNTLIQTIGGDTQARNLAFAVFWRNEAYNPQNYYMPYPGSANEQDLVDTHRDPYTAFLGELPNLYDN